MPENMVAVGSAKIKRNSFLPGSESARFSVNRMLKIVALDFCDPKFPIYCLFLMFVKLFLKLKNLSRIKFDSSIPVNVRMKQDVSRYFETTVGMIIGYYPISGLT
jgi:hypothetical protein